MKGELFNGEIIAIGKYMIGELIELKPKTQVWKILSSNAIDVFGVVKWYPDWRQYCFFSKENFVFSAGCLQDIIEFIEKLNTKHSEGRENHKSTDEALS